MFDDTVWIPTHEIIRLARQNGIDLGTGNPEHRIRYLIKLGILPYQIRKKDSRGRVVGHLPAAVLSTLKQLQFSRHSLISSGTGVLPPSSLVTNIGDRKYLSPAWALTLILATAITFWAIFSKLNNRQQLAMPVNDTKAPAVTIIVNSPASFDKQKLVGKILTELAVGPARAESFWAAPPPLDYLPATKPALSGKCLEL